MIWVAYSIAWICTASVTIYGIHETGRLVCLFTLLIPAMMGISSGSSSDSKDKSSNDNEEKEEDE